LPKKQKQFALQGVPKSSAKIRGVSVPDKKPKARRKRVWILAAGLLVVAAIFAFTRDWRRTVAPKKPMPITAKPIAKPFKQPTTLAELMALTPAELDHCDIARMDLLCTQGLPGAAKVNIPEMLAMIDGWVELVNWETDMNEYQFVQNPKSFGYSEGRYRMIALVTVLDKKFHVHYNPALMDPTVPGDVFYGDSRNVFINGLLGPEHMGTCSSMPVLYVAVARRLGYPVSLAEAKNHFFAQWNDGKDHINIECTTWGYAEHDDEHYEKWPIPLTDDDRKQNRYLKPLSGAEELSEFLENRGIMLVQDTIRDYGGALACFKKAHELTPNWPELDWCIKNLTDAIESDLDELHRLSDLPRQANTASPPVEPGDQILPHAQRSIYVPMGMTEETYLSSMTPAIRKQMEALDPTPQPNQPVEPKSYRVPPPDTSRYATPESDSPQPLKQLSGYDRPPESYKIPWYIEKGIMPAFVQQSTEHSLNPNTNLQIH
jgi:hypothetical protein